MKIWVTGSTGMVGSQLCKTLSLGSDQRSYQVLTSSRQQVDLTSKFSVLEFLNSNKPDLVIHCAGRVGGIQANMDAPVDFLVQNSEIGLNVINGCYQAGVRKLINLASSCVYPKNVDGFLSEDMILTGPLEPTNEGYAIAKIMALRLCEYIAKQDDQYHYKTLIPCNLYGPGDHFDLHKSHLLPAIIMKIDQVLANGFDEVEIWGDGLARREFMYVQDLVEAIVFTINNFEKVPDLFNVGLGYDYSINDYYLAVAKVMGYEGRFKHDLSKPSGMKRKLVSVEKLTKAGWKASTSLEQGIMNTVQYYKRSKNA